MQSFHGNTDNKDTIGDLLGSLDHREEQSNINKSDNSNLLRKRQKATQKKPANPTPGESLESEDKEKSRYDHIQELNKLLNANDTTTLNEGYVEIFILTFYGLCKFLGIRTNFADRTGWLISL